MAVRVTAVLGSHSAPWSVPWSCHLSGPDNRGGGTSPTPLGCLKTPTPLHPLHPVLPPPFYPLPLQPHVLRHCNFTPMAVTWPRRPQWGHPTPGPPAPPHPRAPAPTPPTGPHPHPAGVGKASINTRASGVWVFHLLFKPKREVGPYSWCVYSSSWVGDLHAGRGQVGDGSAGWLHPGPP